MPAGVLPCLMWCVPPAHQPLAEHPLFIPVQYHAQAADAMRVDHYGGPGREFFGHDRARLAVLAAGDHAPLFAGDRLRRVAHGYRGSRTLIFGATTNSHLNVRDLPHVALSAQYMRRDATNGCRSGCCHGGTDPPIGLTPTEGYTSRPAR